MKGQGMHYLKKSGYKYKGELKNNKFYRKGKLIYNNKNIYEDSFVDWYKSGKDKLVFSDGAYYEGHFDKNSICGKSKFNYKDEKNYKGIWKNNIMDGKRIFIWGSNFKYNVE